MNIEHSSRIWLPRTGQVTSYAAGDDGWYQAGNPRKTRFIDNGNGTISDRATGLMYIKSIAAPGSPFDAAANWETTLANIAALNAGAGYAGHRDWRMPNLWEGLSIANLSSAVTPAPFENSNTLLWSSSPGPTADNRFQYNDRWNGYMAYEATKTSLRRVRPVRGGRINANW